MPIVKFRFIFALFILIPGWALFAAAKPPLDANTPSRAVNRLGVTASLGGPGLVYTVAADYYLTPNFDIEIGGAFMPRSTVSDLGYFFSHAGVKYAFLGHQAGQRWSPYIGAFALLMVFNSEITFYQNNNFFSVVSSKENISAPFFGMYFPAGIELIAFNGFTFAVEVAYVYGPNQSTTVQSKNIPGASSTFTTSSSSNAWGGIRFGYHF
jgi:hypothetical protein